MLSQINASADVAALDAAFHAILTANPQCYDEILKAYKEKRASLLGGIGCKTTPSPEKERQRARKFWLYSFIFAMSLTLFFSFLCIEQIYARERFDSLLKEDAAFKEKVGLYLDQGYSDKKVFLAFYQDEEGKRLLLDAGFLTWIASTFLVFLSVGCFFYFFLYKGNQISLGMSSLVGGVMETVASVLFVLVIRIEGMNVVFLLLSISAAMLAWGWYVLCCANVKKTTDMTPKL